MRLTDESTAKFEIKSADEQVRKIKQYINDCQVRFGKIMGCGTCKALQLCTWTKELCNTIECMKKHIEALQQENEQLKDENASIRKRNRSMPEEFAKSIGGDRVICPVCNGNEKMVEKDNYHVCPKCLTEVWPPEKPERGEYKKKEEISSPALMLWHKEDIDHKPPLPAGVPVYKGGGKSGRKRRKKVKRDIRTMYET